MTVPATVGGLAPGDWATWAVAATSFLAFAAVVVGLVIEAKHRKADIRRIERERRDDRIGEQARRIGAYVKESTDYPRAMRPDEMLLVVVVTNGSPLPVHEIEGDLIDARGQIVAQITPCDVVEPGSDKSQQMIVRRSTSAVRSRITFRDDSGVRWEKFSGESLRRLSDV